MPCPCALREEERSRGQSADATGIFPYAGDPMKDFADASWRDLLAVFIVTAVILVAISIIRDQVLLSSTALVGLPLGGALAAGALALAKRREHR